MLHNLCFLIDSAWTYLQSDGIDASNGMSSDESDKFKLYNSRAADVL